MRQVDFEQKVAEGECEGKDCRKGVVQWMASDETQAAPPQSQPFNVTAG